VSSLGLAGEIRAFPLDRRDKRNRLPDRSTSPFALRLWVKGTRPGRRPHDHPAARRPDHRPRPKLEKDGWLPLVLRRDFESGAHVLGVEFTNDFKSEATSEDRNVWLGALDIVLGRSKACAAGRAAGARSPSPSRPKGECDLDHAPIFEGKRSGPPGRTFSPSSCYKPSRSRFLGTAASGGGRSSPASARYHRIGCSS